MQASLRNQLQRLDTALVQLLQERAKLLSGVPHDDADRTPCVEDLLRQTSGAFNAEVLAEILQAAERGTRS